MGCDLSMIERRFGVKHLDSFNTTSVDMMICQVWKCRYGGGESDPKEVLGVDNTGDFEGSVSIVSDTIGISNINQWILPQIRWVILKDLFLLYQIRLVYSISINRYLPQRRRVLW